MTEKAGGGVLDPILRFDIPHRGRSRLRSAETVEPRCWIRIYFWLRALSYAHNNGIIVVR